MASSPERHLLSGSHALNALPGNEQADFEKYLRQSPASEEEVRGLRETAARLGMATAISPPPEMRARVLAALPRTRQLPPVGPSTPTRAWRRPRPSRAAITTGILALAAAVVFLLVMQVSTLRQLHDTQTASRAVAAVLAAPDAHVESVPATGGGRVTAVVSVRQREAVVTSAGLPALSGARVYQLWVMTASGAARSAGLLTVSVTGRSEPALAAGVLPGDRLGITVEPAGGTAQPTTTPVVIVSVTA